ncbi:hypothetical protein N9I27_02920 [Flavobacteriaceae bacterium]|nr:hypothetical protein [Flavobacteriaceae bacterium]MDA8849515.1 hypothetical protein [Flavobacteriaceae bacterium]MDB4063922.1 hypothetical protein [Flavobacteriaceae bacterium]MDC1392956.1 hypothetical protein [Flavobacteriaceae bacterium]
MDNKYRQKSVSYTNKSLETFLSEEATPEAGTKGTYIGVEQLNEDYVDCEREYYDD